MIEVEKTIYDNGTISYFVKGTNFLHREDGPALIYSDGAKKWYLNGMRHRDDGPAVIHMNGEIEWWLYGDSCNKETWFKNLPEDKKLEQLYSNYFIES